MKKVILLLLAGIYQPELCAKELSSVDVYEHTQQSVVALEEHDDKGNLLRSLTAVAVTKNSAVTLCDNQSASHDLRLIVNKKPIKVAITARDSQRNLCLLAVSEAELSPIEIINPSLAAQSGTRVFAISNALGLGVGISEGVISGIRSQFGTDYIQFSAPVSPGSDGGALVDSEGRLLGIINYQYRDGQNVNFAIPAKWFAEIEQHDKSDIAHKQLGELAEQLTRQELWDKLTDHVGQWISLYPGDTDAWRWAAFAADKNGNPDAEEKAWRKLRELAPASTSFGTGLVRVLLKRKQGSDALKQAYELLSLRQEDGEIWTLIGQTEQTAGSTEKAEAAYRKALSFNPWQLVAYQGLINISEQRNDRGTVTRLWQRLASLYPDAPKIELGLINAYLNEGRPARAYTLLHKLSVPGEQKADATVLKGQTLAALGRPADAIRAFQESLQGKPTNKAWVYAALGHSYFELGRLPESIQAYREAVQLDPNNDEWQFGLTISLKDDGHALEAVELDDRLLKKSPNNPSFWRQKGFAEGTLGRDQDSIKSLEKSLELDPKQGKTWMALIETYHHVGRDNDARIAYEKLRGIDSEWADKAYRSTILPFEEQHP